MQLVTAILKKHFLLILIHEKEVNLIVLKIYLRKVYSPVAVLNVMK
jgi:hypothetical protein